jgi:hypothetical protein
MLLLARIIGIVVGVVVAIIALAIAFVVFDANATNTVVSHVNDWAGALVGPLDSVFSPRDHKLAVGLNYGLAIVLYVIAGALVRRALTAPALAWRRPLR